MPLTEIIICAQLHLPPKEPEKPHTHPIEYIYDPGSERSQTPDSARYTSLVLEREEIRHDPTDALKTRTVSRVPRSGVRTYVSLRGR